MIAHDDPVFRMLRRRLDAGEMTRAEYDERRKSKLYEPPEINVEAVLAILEAYTTSLLSPATRCPTEHPEVLSACAGEHHQMCSSNPQ